MPPYPPERNVWQFPPPPVSRRWLWAAVLAAVSSLVAAVGLGVTATVIASQDFPSLIENHQLLTVITHECQLMTEAIESTPVAGSPKEQAAILVDQDKSVEHMVQVIRLFDAGVRAADRPTDQWLADWDRLIRARERYAVLVGHGHQPVFRIPRDAHGTLIVKRMNDVGLTSSACRVPAHLLDPSSRDNTDV